MFVARQNRDFAELHLVKPTLGHITGAVGLLEKVNEVVDGSIEDLHVAAKVETQDTCVLEKPDSVVSARI